MRCSRVQKLCKQVWEINWNGFYVMLHHWLFRQRVVEYWWVNHHTFKNFHQVLEALLQFIWASITFFKRSQFLEKKLDFFEFKKICSETLCCWCVVYKCLNKLFLHEKTTLFPSPSSPLFSLPLALVGPSSLPLPFRAPLPSLIR